MQKNRFCHARRIFLGLGVALGLGLAGCRTPAITNLTPSSLPENPSQIYTISARIAPKESGLVPGSVLPRIIIDGQPHLMTKSPLGADIYEFEYQVPPGRTEIAYYFLTTYQVTNNDVISSREVFSDLQRAQVVGRYVLSLEANRGPIGARVSILGRGFTPSDIVYFDEMPVRTVFESPNSISFYVPSVESNRNYRVSLGSSIGSSPVGTFRVDAGAGGPAQSAPANFGSPGAAPASAPAAAGLSANPSSLNLKQGQKVTLTFNTPSPAPGGGLLVDITTDIPESIIMPEVLIPAGSTSASVTIEGGRPGTGSLFARGAGGKELAIPVTVK